MSKSHKIIISTVILIFIGGISFFYFLSSKDTPKDVIRSAVNPGFSELYEKCLANRTKYYNSPEYYELQQCDYHLQSKDCDEMEKILKNKKNNSSSGGMTYEEHITRIYYPCCENGIKESIIRECNQNIKTEHGRELILSQLENEK